MAQARVTEYFSTRGNKRNRLGGGDEVLLNKSTKSQGLPDSPKHDDEITLIKQRLHATINQEQRRATRSKTKSTAEQSTAAATTVQEAPTKKTREAAGAKKREEIKALKAKMNHVNFQIEKAVAEPEPAPEASAKKRLNRDELKKKMEQFNARLVHIQSQEPEKTTTTSAVVQKDEPQQTPAYLKFQELSEKQPPVASEETLPLPKSYALLLDFFKACETILKMMTNRNDPVTFQRLKRGVENITKHTFALRHLGQLRHVYPEAYSFRQEKMFIDFKNDYHLLIAPNFAEIEASQASGQREFTPAVMLKRQTQCEANLLRIVKEQHRTFLDSLGMDGLVDDGERRLKRWHPKFELDRAAEIEIAELPRPPSQDSVECKTGKELLNIAAAIYSSRIQEAIKATVEELDAKVRADETDEVKVRAPSTAAAASKAEDSQNLTPDQLAQIKLKEKKESAHNALLERIRNKEKQKALESMIVNSDKERTLARYAHFKDAVRFLLHFYASEKKSTLEMDKCVKKMAENSKAQLAEHECRELLSSMSSDDKSINLFVCAEGTKKWLHQIKVRNVTYLQMSKDFQLNELNAMVDAAVTKLKS